MILIYYGGSNGLHNNWREGSLNLATLELDRWAGYAPADENEPARLETRPLQLAGHSLSVNAEVEPGGEIRFMLLDAGGAPLDGYGFADCLPLTTGGAVCELRWRGRPVSALRGKSARLVFEIQNAKLYALSGIRVPDSDLA